MTRQQLRNWLDMGCLLLAAWLVCLGSVVKDMGWV